MQNVLIAITHSIRTRVTDFNETAARGTGFSEQKINDATGQAIA
jgi:hypothetical protein